MCRDRSLAVESFGSTGATILGCDNFISIEIGT
jgi:hypothetical protein